MKMYLIPAVAVMLLSVQLVVVSAQQPIDLRPSPPDYRNTLPTRPADLSPAPSPLPAPRIDIQIGPGYVGGTVTIPH